MVQVSECNFVLNIGYSSESVQEAELRMPQSFRTLFLILLLLAEPLFNELHERKSARFSRQNLDMLVFLRGT